MSRVFTAAASQKLFDMLLPWDLTQQRPLQRLTLQAMASMRRAVHAPNAWLFHTGHSGLEHAHYERGVHRHGLRPLFFIHDLIPITHPQYCRDGEARKHVRRIRHMLAWSHGLIANSQLTADTLATYAQQSGQTLPPVLTAHLAPAQWPVYTGTPPLAEPYFVALSTIEPRKNFSLLMTVWRSLIDELGDKAPVLVVIGQPGWDHPSVLRDLGDSAQWRGKLIWHKQCNDTGLAAWVRHARALLFPSFVEGYGLPVAEALASGVPVISSDLAPIREIAGNTTELLDTQNAAAWRNAVLDYAQPDSTARRTQLAKMGALSLPTWGQHFVLVDEFLDKIAHAVPKPSR